MNGGQNVVIGATTVKKFTVSVIGLQAGGEASLSLWRGASRMLSCGA
ncbi:hypothetical protein [Streptomyces mirabilis]